MKQRIQGRVFVLGEDIDTDQIIPARYLVYSLDDPEERKKYGNYCLSGVPIEQAGLPEGGRPFIQGDAYESEFNLIIAGKNFGCGSSREHAPAAMQIAGVEAVIAPSYARIFYRNAVDGGFLVPAESEESLVAHFQTGDEIVLDFKAGYVENSSRGGRFPVRSLGQVAEIIEAGGIFGYARKHGMIAEAVDA